MDISLLSWTRLRKHCEFFPVRAITSRSLLLRGACVYHARSSTTSWTVCGEASALEWVVVGESSSEIYIILPTLRQSPPFDHAKQRPQLRRCSNFLGLRLVPETQLEEELTAIRLENCPASSNTSGYLLVNQIRELALMYGIIKIFKAYVECSEQLRAQILRSELQSSGVSLTDCPHMGKKDVADKMMIGMLTSSAISSEITNSRRQLT